MSTTTTKPLDSERIHCVCEYCGSVVYRETGATYGDGSVDSDESPVWLLADDDVDGDDLPEVNCGCTE